ncbi:DUF58 domain-containing protein [Saxibacter everestensis]|uniref:DUF58 domain-containing protein n=1 Tax=Saxibacter everestensis TaxID=2909229 RepID=A0ABY8QWG6_9MICO|nr:DUF58 domain-containing protein [Brevibacteriaceae bacterium ZFBP1038]
MRLTLSGWVFLGVGIALLVAAYLTNFAGLRAIGILTLALPASSLLVLNWRRNLPLAHLIVQPLEALPGAPVSVGQLARIVVALRNPDLRPASGARLTLQMSPSLGPAVMATSSVLGPGEAQDLEHTIRPTTRGQFELGPLTAEMYGPFSLCRRRLTLISSYPVLVGPRLHRLSDAGALSSRRNAEEQHRMQQGNGTHDFTSRSYQVGDDLRHVHWPSTARHGELMVRQEANADIRRITVFLDSAVSSYQHADDFEWMVSAASSATTHFAQGGYEVELHTQDGHAGTFGGGGDPTHSIAAAHRTFAGIELTDRAYVTSTATPLRHEQLGSAVRLAFLGSDGAEQQAITHGLSARSTADSLELAFVAGPANEEATSGFTLQPVISSDRVDQAWISLLERLDQ